MREKALLIFMVWLVVATAAASSIAFAKYFKQSKVSSEIAAKVEIDTKKDVVESAEQKEENVPNEEDLKAREDRKNEILDNLDQSMEKIIFE